MVSLLTATIRHSRLPTSAARRSDTRADESRYAMKSAHTGCGEGTRTLKCPTVEIADPCFIANRVVGGTLLHQRICWSYPTSYSRPMFHSESLVGGTLLFVGRCDNGVECYERVCNVFVSFRRMRPLIAWNPLGTFRVQSAAVALKMHFLLETMCSIISSPTSKNIKGMFRIKRGVFIL